jgi:hypothetical protein
LDEKKSLGIAFAALAAALVLTARAQQKIVVQPEPSYREDASANRRQPGLETDVSLYINHWRNSPPREGHGGLLERDILTRGDPFEPSQKGAVLRYLSAYRRAELSPHVETREFKDAGEQIFLYIMTGRGSIHANKRTVELEEGTAVVIPAGLSYRLSNPAAVPLELFLAAEETPAGFVPQKELSVGRFRDSKPIVGAHWAHIARPFVYDREPKFANPMGFVVVSMDFASPAHAHPAAAEEISSTKGTASYG